MDLFFIVDRNEWPADFEGPRRFIVAVHKSINGTNGRTVRAINHFTEERLARCTGGGYNMVGTVLADAVDRLVGDRLKLRPDGDHYAPIDGASGEQAVIDYYASFGVDICDDTGALWSL